MCNASLLSNLWGTLHGKQCFDKRSLYAETERSYFFQMVTAAPVEPALIVTS